MRIPAVLLGLGTIVTCASIPFELMERGDETHPLGLLEWSGALYKGGPIVEYAGEDLDDIDTQVKKDYPGLSIYGAPGSEDDDDISLAAESPEAVAEGRLMARSGHKTECTKTLGAVSATFQMNNVWQNLKKAGGLCKAASKTCVRVGCYKTAGAALCNHGSKTLTLQCVHVAEHIRVISTSCIAVLPCWVNPMKPSSCPMEVYGQRWSPGGTWRVRAGICPDRAKWDY